MSPLLFAFVVFIVGLALIAAYQTGCQIGENRGYNRGQRDGGRLGYLAGREDERAVLGCDHDMPIEQPVIRRA